MSILNNLMLNGVKIWTIKDNFRLGDDIQAKILAFAFGLLAEIERNLISQRTKEALARKKSEGFTLGDLPVVRVNGSNCHAVRRKHCHCWTQKPPKASLHEGSAYAEKSFPNLLPEISFIA